MTNDQLFFLAGAIMICSGKWIVEIVGAIFLVIGGVRMVGVL